MASMKERPGGRSAACPLCNKTFARSDTLLRHQKSHHATEDRGPVHRVTDGTFRACLACATARSRCSGGNPCGRCGVRSIECVYPNKRRKGTAHDDELKQEQILFRVQPTSVREPSQHGPLRFVDAGGHAVLHESSIDQAHRPEGRQELQRHQSFAQDSALGLQQPPHGHVPEPDHGYGMMDSQSHLPQVYNQVNPQYEYPTAWDDSLNWIPISVYPSPYDGELEHDFSFLLPPLSGSPNITFDYNQSIPVDTAPQLYQVPSSTNTYPESGSDGQKFSVAYAGNAQSPTSSISNELSAPRSGPDVSSKGAEKKKRRKSFAVYDEFLQPRRPASVPSFPMNIVSSAEDPDFHPKQYCSTATYDSVVHAFRRLCCGVQQHPKFATSSFPDMDSLNRYIDLYFQNFHGDFPLLHQSSTGHGSHWIIILAAAAIGSNFVKAQYSAQLREALQEFLRRAVVECIEVPPEDASTTVALGQARILNLVSLSQAESERLRAFTARHHAELSQWCLESGALQLAREFPKTSESASPAQLWQAWQEWINDEALRRIGYMTWLFDTSLAYMANIRPMCNMDDARAPLPCSELIWASESVEVWHARIREQSPSPSLCAALEQLYSKKAVDSRSSDMSQILLINALFQRTWEVGTHIKQPLSEWVPTGKARGFLNTPSKDDFWLPLYPLYANWRNSACDCLDVINWEAASIVAKASGKEHTLMLHLHLARIVLLTPFQEIQDLLFSLIGRVGDSSRASFYVHDGSYQPRNKAKLPQIRKITWRWLREDQHKARLAMIHAGSVLWHVRRYSSGSFYEPLAVYLASLVLWTYGSYKSAALERNAANANAKPVGGPSGPDTDLNAVQPSRVERKIRVQDVLINEEDPTKAAAQRQGTEHISDSSSESESDSAKVDLIYLDRPCDDEMIQHFVRNGHNMTAHISNGDICKTPSKVLLEGAKLLRTRLSCWGVSREYFDILTRLAEMRK